MALSGFFATDNSGYMQLNGVTVGPTSSSFTSLTAFSLTSGFVPGINTLDFVVTNGPTGGAANPTGLFVELTGTGTLLSPGPTQILPQFAFGVVDRAGGWVQQVLSRRFDLVVEACREHYRSRAFARIDPETPLLWADSESRRFTSQFGVRVGRARVAATLSGVERVHPVSFQGLLFWVDVSYGIFQVRNR